MDDKELLQSEIKYREQRKHELQKKLEAIIEDFKWEVDLLSVVKDELLEDDAYEDEGHRNHIHNEINQAKRIASEIEAFENSYNMVVEEITANWVTFE